MLAYGEQVWDREKVVLIPDHYIFTADERANRNVDILREFALEQDIKYFYDIKDRSNFRVFYLPILSLRYCIYIFLSTTEAIPL
jgi:homoaconitase/3-isopropylmalate dehydratase large subunit